MFYQIFDTNTAVAVGDHVIEISKTPVTLVATGLGASENINFYISADDGVTWEQMIDTDPVGLSSTKNTQTIYGPVKLSFEKAGTAGAVKFGYSF